MRVLFLFVIFIVSCSDNQHSGVMTETNTGKKISTRILVLATDDRNGEKSIVANAAVTVVAENFVKGRDSILVEGVTDHQGILEFEQNGLENLHIVAYDSGFSKGVFFRLNASDDEREIPQFELTLEKLSKVILHPKSKGWSLEDEICIMGSLICKMVDEKSLQNDYLLFDGIPDGVYTQILRLQKDSNSIIEVDWEFSGEQIFNQGTETLLETSFSVSLPFEAEWAIATGVLEDLPIPIFLENTLESPCLLDEEGNTLLLESDFTGETHTLYWAQIPEFKISLVEQDGLSFEFKGFENCADNDATELPLGIVAEHFEDTEKGILGSGKEFSPAVSYLSLGGGAFRDSLGLSASFWVKMDSAKQGEAYSRIFELRDVEGSGFLVQQRGGTGDVNLRIDTKTGDYNALFGRAKILDGTWHHYAFSVFENELNVYVDGQKLESATFNTGDGFGEFQSPRLGGDPMMTGTLDEILVFSDLKTDLWWLAYYQLQISVENWQGKALGVE